MDRLNTLKFVTLSKSVLLEYQLSITALCSDVFGHNSWTLEQFQQDLPDKWKLSCFALIEGRPVGFRIVSSFVWDDELHAHGHYMATHTQYQGLGIGSKLLEYSHKLCQAKDIFSITTETNEAKSPSLGFYEKNKYVKITDESIVRKYIRARSKSETLLPLYLTGRAGLYLIHLDGKSILNVSYDPADTKI